MSDSQTDPAVRLEHASSTVFGVEQHTFQAPCGCGFEWDALYDDPLWHQCPAHATAETKGEGLSYSEPVKRALPLVARASHEIGGPR